RARSVRDRVAGGHTGVAVGWPRSATARGGPPRPGGRARGRRAVPRLPCQARHARTRLAARAPERHGDAARGHRSHGPPRPPPRRGGALPFGPPAARLRAATRDRTGRRYREVGDAAERGSAGAARTRAIVVVIDRC